MKMKNHYQKGITLIELLAVIRQFFKYYEEFCTVSLLQWI